MPSTIGENFEEKIQLILRRYKIVPLLVFVFMFVFATLFIKDLSKFSVLAVEEYELPYPGILPNHPLYILKAGRDKVLEMFTRSPIRKAELYLLFADKRINMARYIGQSDWSLSEQTASKAEKYLIKSWGAAKNGIKMGTNPDVSYTKRARQSAKAHRTILLNLQKHCPTDYKQKFKATLEINSSFSKWVSTLE